MPDAATTIRFRLLPFTVEIAVEDPDTAAVLRYVANSVEQDDVPVLGALRWRVRGAGPWVLEEQDDVVARYGRIDDLLFVLYRRCYGRVMEHLQLGGWVAVHGGVVRIGEHRAVVVGEKGAGKTTLMMRLLERGHAVEGDELVLVRAGQAVALPRAFHVKPGTAALLPALALALAGSPRTALSDGTPVLAFDPASAGFAVRTSVAPVDVAVVLRHGATATVRELTTVEAVQRVVGHAVAMDDSPARLVSSCAAALARARGFELIRGDLDATASLLVAAVDPR